MALKNLFDMVKADRYTADGREALIKAQEEETEDKVYQIGEISQKTGLQKTANGWVKPKNGKQPGAKKEEVNKSVTSKKDEIWKDMKKREGALRAKGMTSRHFMDDPEYAHLSELYKNELETEEKPAVEKFDIEKWKTGPKVEKNSKLDWSHGVVGESIPVQEKSAEEKRNLINKYNSVGRLSKIGTKKKSYYNNKHGTFEVAGIDNDNVYIQEERSNGMGSKYMVLVTIPLNEVEEINPFHDYGKRNPDTGEESPTRPPLPEDSAPRILTGDTRIRVRKA